jgi:TfoX/Sxy family transcriptional regulator of competence genes
MAFDEKLAGRIRIALADQLNVEEVKMFRGVTFMVNGKMCISVSNNEMMCRINPDLTAGILEEPHFRPMTRNGKIIKGYVFISEEGLKTNDGFKRWLRLALEYNQVAKSAKIKRNKTA